MPAPIRLALALVAAAACPLASAATRLVSSLPVPGQVLAAPPTDIRLVFSDRVDPRHTVIKLVSAKGQRYDCDRPVADRDDPNMLVAAVPVLRSGSWRAHWIATAADGHRLHGDVSFSIK